MHGTINEYGEALCYSCNTLAGVYADGEDRILRPDTDAGTVCGDCDLVLSRGGKWVDVGGN